MDDTNARKPQFPYVSQIIITGRNEFVAKVMFLHMSVNLFTGGVTGQAQLCD